MHSDPRIDRLTRLATRLLGATVTILPLEGAAAAGAGGGAMPRAGGGRPASSVSLTDALVRRAAASRAPVVIPDMRVAGFLAGDGAVAVEDELGVASCAAVPLLNERGEPFGALCALGARPRAWSADDLEALREVAESVVAEIEHAAELERRQAAERMLREVEARLTDLAERASDLIVVTAPEDGRLLYVNEAWKRTFGYDDAEAAAMHALDVVAPEFHERCLEASRRIVHGEPVRDFEAVLLTKQGRRVVVRGNGSARFENGRAVAVRMMFRDVTAQLQAEMAQRRLVATLGASADFVAIGTVAGAATYINPAGRRMLGIGADEDITGLPMADIHPAWARERLAREALPAALRDGAWAGELALIARDGREIPVSQVILAHESPRGGRWFISTVARDVSAEKQSQAETQLLHATARAVGAAPSVDAGLAAALRLLGAWAGWIYGEAWLPTADGALLQCGPIWMAEHDPALVARLNHFAESSRMFSFRAGEGLPGHVWQTREPLWIVPEYEGVEFPRRAFARAAGLVAVGAVPLLGHAGEVIAVLTFGAGQSRPADESAVRTLGAVCAQLGTAVQRKRAEQALRESEARFRRLSDASSDGVAIFDGGTILQVNPAFCDLFACAESDAVGVSGLLFCAPEDRALLARHFRSGSDARFEITAVRKDGSSFRAEVCTSTVAYDGRQADVAVIRDVSERSSVGADHGRHEIVSLLSHELHTPLRSIRGALGLIEAAVAASAPGGQLATGALELLRIARANADRALRLAGDVRDAGMIESGALALRTAELSPRALLGAAAEGVRAHAEQHRVRVETRVDDETPLAGDADRLTQVLVTLLWNAVQHSPHQGVVTATASRAASSGAARFEVVDHGTGIPAEKLPHLFTRFQPIDPDAARRRGGAGLGLALARSLVELHGGTMGVESEPGVRTVFWFEIPRG